MNNLLSYIYNYQNYRLVYILSIITTIFSIPMNNIFIDLDNFLNNIPDIIFKIIKIFIINFIIVFIFYNTLIQFNKTDRFTTEQIREIKDRLLYRNEPYLIQYTNPYINNLDNIDFNFKKIYINDFMTDKMNIKLYIKNKINELLIGKYVKIHDILSFKNKPWDDVTIDYNDTYNALFIPNTITNIKSDTNIHDYSLVSNVNKTFSEKSKQINFNTNKLLLLSKGDIIKIPSKGFDTDNTIITANNDNNDKYHSGYIYVFEQTDNRYYNTNNNISIIYDDYTIINTREFLNNVNYVYYTSNEILPPNKKILNKPFLPQNNIIINPIIINKIITIKNNITIGSTPETTLTDIIINKTITTKDEVIIKYISIDNKEIFYIGKINGNTTINIIDTITSKTDIIKFKQYFYDRHEYEKYIPTFDNHCIYVIKYHAQANILSNKPIIKPLIVLNKNNNIRPLYYKNMTNTFQINKYIDWLLNTYTTFIKTQFKGRILRVEGLYKKYLNDGKKNLKFNTIVNNDYIWYTDDVSNIIYTDHIYDYYKLNNDNIKLGDYGFIIYICNIKQPIDKDNKTLDYTDNDNRSYGSENLPYLLIKYYKLTHKDIKQVNIINDTITTYTKIDNNTSSTPETEQSIFYYHETGDKNSKYKSGDNGKYAFKKDFIKGFESSGTIIDNKTFVIKLFNTYNDKDYSTGNMFNKTKSINSTILELHKQDLKKLENKKSTEVDNLQKEQDKTTGIVDYLLNMFNPRTEKKIQSDYTYITNTFVNTQNISDYKNKMTYIADKIIANNYTDNIKSITNYTFNLQNLNIVPIQLKNNIYMYDTINRLQLNNKYITNDNITKIYKDIDVLRYHYILFLKDIMKDIWQVQQTDKFVTSRELSYKINQIPFDSKSYTINIKMTLNNTPKNPIYTVETVNLSSHKVGNFIKINGNIHCIYKINSHYNNYKTKTGTDKIKYIEDSDNGYVRDISFINKIVNNNVLSSIRDLSYDNIKYYYSNNIKNIKLQNKIKRIIVYKDDPYIFSIQCSRINNDAIGDWFTFHNQYNVFANEFKYVSDDIDTSNDKIVGKLLNNRFYLNITPKNYQHRYIDKLNNSKISYCGQNGITEVLLTLPIDNTDNNTSWLTFYSNEKLYDDPSNPPDKLHNDIYNTKNNMSDSDKKKMDLVLANINISSYIDSKNYKELIKIQTIMNRSTNYNSKNIITFNNPQFTFYKNIKEIIKNMTTGVTLTKEIIQDFSIEDYFINDDGTNFNLLIDNICYAESMYIYYNIPSNIGIYETSNNTVSNIKFKNDIFIPYKFRNKELKDISIIDGSQICEPSAEITYLKDLGVSKKYKLFSHEEYFKFYYNILKTILGIYTDIHLSCTQFHQNKNIKKTLPESFGNYVTFKNDYLLYYRNDEDNLNTSIINKSELNRPVFINNILFNNNFINTTNSNRYNTNKLKQYFISLIKQKEIGFKGYDYDAGKEICKRIYTIENINCNVDIYSKEKVNTDKDLARNKCFSTIFNNKTDIEEKKLKEQGKWLFPEKDTSLINQIAYKENINNVNILENKLNIIQHRQANIHDIKSNMWYNLDWNKIGWINSYDKDTSLIRPHNNFAQKEHYIQYYDNNIIDTIPDKGVICYGKKPYKFDESDLHKIKEFQQKKLKQHMIDIQKKDLIEEFDTSELYSKWSN